MTKKYNLYLGKAGHLVVMSELLIRGWNVAIPEVDIGDDIFVVEDEKGVLRRVQVKTSKYYQSKKGYSGKFQIPLRQLENVREVLIHYVFIVRKSDGWSKPIIIAQDALLDYREQNQIGTFYENKINLNFSYFNDTVKCSGLDISKHINDYQNFPLIEH